MQAPDFWLLGLGDGAEDRGRGCHVLASPCKAREWVRPADDVRVDLTCAASGAAGARTGVFFPAEHRLCLVDLSQLVKNRRRRLEEGGGGE